MHSSEAVPAGRPWARLGHVGLTVPDVAAAVDWYRDVFGWTLIAGPLQVSTRDAAVAPQLRDVFDAESVAFVQAHMLAGEDVAVELFAFSEPAETGGEARFDYVQPGYTHICLVAPDLDAAVARVTDRGGERLTQIHDIFPGEPFRFVYCRDPFGTIIELASHDHREAFAGRKQY